MTKVAGVCLADDGQQLAVHWEPHEAHTVEDLAAPLAQALKAIGAASGGAPRPSASRWRGWWTRPDASCCADASRLTASTPWPFAGAAEPPPIALDGVGPTAAAVGAALYAGVRSDRPAPAVPRAPTHPRPEQEHRP